MPHKPRHLVNSHMVVFAFRYAIGRRTAAVSIVVEHLIRLWPDLSKIDHRQIKKEIAQAITRGEAGDNCDIAEWTKVLNLDYGKPPWKHE